ncbi:Uncharacterized protein SCF082_LOCUS21362 [Durusdinium trenchii]|uniref:Uncharacterized protein n=1 Tax=Durusdinium trenchii TaxID=1381693 RepID=A0ABP0L8W6_9DINO
MHQEILHGNDPRYDELREFFKQFEGEVRSERGVSEAEKQIQRIEYEWPGHLCVAMQCQFRRNTAVVAGDSALIVSSIGDWVNSEGHQESIGAGRHYETMVFYAEKNKHGTYAVGNWREIMADGFESSGDNALDYPQANEMHEAAVSDRTGDVSINKRVAVAGRCGANEAAMDDVTVKAEIVPMNFDQPAAPPQPLGGI